MKCKQCGAMDVEEDRESWATPVCFACLPPPKKLLRAPCSYAGRSGAAKPCGKPATHAHLCEPHWRLLAAADPRDGRQGKERP